jgi:hypothetical protein
MAAHESHRLQVALLDGAEIDETDAPLRQTSADGLAVYSSES